MKTFERVFKEKFKGQLAGFIDKPIIVSNDINTKPLEDDPNELAVIIRTSPGTKSAKAGYDLTTLTFYVDMITEANDVQPVLGAINNLILIYNAEWSNLIIPVYNPATDVTTDKVFYYKPIYSTPFIPGQAFNLRTKRATISAVAITMSITVGYSSNAAVLPASFELLINGTSYPINYLRYEITNNPVYEPASVVGAKLLKQYLINNVVSYSFTLLKLAPGFDALHDILSSDPLGEAENMLSTKTLKLTSGGKTVDISTCLISEIYQDGAAVIVLTLTR